MLDRRQAAARVTLGRAAIGPEGGEKDENPVSPFRWALYGRPRIVRRPLQK